MKNDLPFHKKDNVMNFSYQSNFWFDVKYFSDSSLPSGVSPGSFPWPLITFISFPLSLTFSYAPQLTLLWAPVICWTTCSSQTFRGLYAALSVWNSKLSTVFLSNNLLTFTTCLKSVSSEESKNLLGLYSLPIKTFSQAPSDKCYLSKHFWCWIIIMYLSISLIHLLKRSIII